MSVEDCLHEPGRVYVWELPGEEKMERHLYSTCAKCHSDYRIPNDEIVRRCTSPDESNPPFHVRFKIACDLYKAREHK